MKCLEESGAIGATVSWGLVGVGLISVGLLISTVGSGFGHLFKPIGFSGGLVLAGSGILAIEAIVLACIYIEEKFSEEPEISLIHEIHPLPPDTVKAYPQFTLAPGMRGTIKFLVGYSENFTNSHDYVSSEAAAKRNTLDHEAAFQRAKDDL